VARTSKKLIADADVSNDETSTYGRPAGNQFTDMPA
jgi:hypothetical protein